MAFVQSAIPEEEQNQFSKQGTTTPNPLALVPPQAGGSAGQGGSVKAAPSVGTSTQFGSGASRLSDYLNANKDQVQGMANEIAGGLTGKYGDVYGQIGQAGQQFGQQVAGGYTPTDPTNLQQVKDNPVGAANDPVALAKFRSQLSSNYTGPASFEASDPYMNVQKNVQDAMSNADLVNTYPGLSTYLRNNMASNATPGQNTLDTILLQGNLPAYQTIKGAAAPYKGLGDYLGNVAQQQTEAVSQAQAGAKAAREGAQTAIQGPIDVFNNSLTDKVNKAVADSTGFNQDYNDILSKINEGGGNLTAQQLQKLGLTPESYGYITKLNQFNRNFAPGFENPQPLSAWTTPGSIMTGVPTRENIASDQDYAMEAALQALSGQDFGLPDQRVGAYNGGGKMPIIDYSGAFSAGGNALNKADRDFLAAVGTNVDQSIADKTLAGFVPRSGYDVNSELANSMSALSRLTTPGYYTDPTTDIPQEGAAYPYPTSQSPGPGFVWNTATGTWVDMGNAPPNLGGTGGGGSGGGGGPNTFIRPYGV